MSDKATTERCSMDDVIDLYKKDVDRTLIRAQLALSVEERTMKMLKFVEDLKAWRNSAVESAAK